VPQEYVCNILHKGDSGGDDDDDDDNNNNSHALHNTITEKQQKYADFKEELIKAGQL
jgi:hypothetical protein